MRRLFRGVLMFLGTIFLVMIVLIGVGIWMARTPAIPAQGVLLVRMHGPLLETRAFSFATTFGNGNHLTLHELTDAIRHAAKDTNIKGLVVRVENPQLGLSQVQEFSQAMQVFRASNKWTLGFLDSAGEVGQGDGAYMLAASADRVMMAPSGSLNLFGLHLEVPFVHTLLQRLKITPHFAQRKDYKSAPNTFLRTESSPAQRENLSTLVADLQRAAIGTIASRRHLKQEVVHTRLQGAPLEANAAKQAGLIDDVMYWDGIRTEAAKHANEKQEPFIGIEDYAHDAMHMRPNGTSVAMIIASGTIMLGESSENLGGDGTVGSATITDAFHQARADKVKAVLFRVNSPGGSYVASDAIRREVQLTREAGIPVVVSMGDMAASGGYFVAMDANTIVAQPSTITGSIGVYAGTFAMRTFFRDWLGINFDAYNGIDNPHRLDWLDAPTPKAEQALNRTLDLIYDDFVGKAAKARHVPVATMERSAQGQVWSGDAALKRGLVDHLGGMHEAEMQLRKLANIPESQHIDYALYPAPKTALDIARELMRGETNATRAAMQIWRASSNASASGDHQSSPLPAPMRHTAHMLERMIATAHDNVLLCPYGLAL